MLEKEDVDPKEAQAQQMTLVDSLSKKTVAFEEVTPRKILMAIAEDQTQSDESQRAIFLKAGRVRNARVVETLQ